MTSSAEAGIPFKPSTVDIYPSCMEPPEESSRSSQWEMRGRPSIRAYCMPLRIRAALATGIPSSEKATAPAFLISPISASSLPLLPRVMEPTGKTWAAHCSRAVSKMYRIRAAVSATGLVLGMQATAVKPPRAAARVPVRMVSLAS